MALDYSNLSYITPAFTNTSVIGNGDNWSTDGDPSFSKYVLNAAEVYWGLKILPTEDVDKPETLETTLDVLQAIVYLLQNVNKVVVTPTATFSSTTITRGKGTTLQSISWSGASAPSTINSGNTGTLTKGKVTATYNNIDGTTTITFSNFTNIPTVTSSDTSVVTVGSISGTSGTIKLTGIAVGTSTITIKDGDTVVNIQSVTVKNGSATSDVTSSAKFRQYIGSSTTIVGSIDGTTITAPTVTEDTTVTIKATYGEETAPETVKYTAKYVEEVITYFSVGQTAITEDNYTTANNATTTIPETYEYTNPTKSYVYLLAPSTKTVSAIGKITRGKIIFIEMTDISIDNYTVYRTVVTAGSTIVITIE